MDNTTKARHTGSTWPKIVLVAASAAVLLAAAIAGGFLIARHKAEQSSGDPAVVKRRIIGEVSRIYDTPTAEDPSVALVKDPADLRQSSPFFAHAQSGDYLVLYSHAHLVVVYRESQNKIIGIATVSADQTVTQKRQP